MTGLTPLSPRTSRGQNVLTPLPNGVTKPIPVIATRLFILAPLSKRFD
jgi:hypothetical protein